MPDHDRPLDLVLWGATGFTGTLVAEYLLRQHGAQAALRWAIGGRSQAKLEKVRERLAAIDASAARLPIVLGDAMDRASLDAVARQTRVVCSTAGPFAKVGRELVAACAEAGTDYCDSTGEPQFVRAMIDAHHERARKTGARIVSCCGFDSIPSDLGNLMVQEAARTAHGSRCVEVRHFVRLRGGAISGGTAASMVQIMEEASHDAAVRRVMADPYALDPGFDGPRSKDMDLHRVSWDDDLGAWTGPFVMAGINARVVRRSNAMLGYAWGRDFHYVEGLSFGASSAGWLKAVGMSAGIATVFGAMAVSPIRQFVAERFLPSPGQGPSKEQRARSSFTSRFIGVLEGSGSVMRATVSSVGDPGYDETAKMLGESSMCLARDHASTRTEGGVLTPSSCMGMALVERLRKQGMTFDVA